MTRSVAIVTGADAGYFPLIQGCIRSIRDKAPGRDIDLAVFDLGLEAAQRRWVETVADIVVEPGWDLDFPGRIEMPRHFQAMTARPFLPRHVPGHETYVWIDADAWVQDWSAIELYLQAAEVGMAITPEIDRAYRHHYHAGPEFRGVIGKAYGEAFGEVEAAELVHYALLNTGVFALRGEAPHWRAWETELADALQRSRNVLVEQLALNRAVYRQGLAVRFLPSWCNWICHHATPAYDDAAGFVEPHPPHRRLGILHLTLHTKRVPELSVAVVGSEPATRMMSLRYPGACPPSWPSPAARARGIAGESVGRGAGAGLYPRAMSGLSFIKMHGLGNDFVVLDARAQPIRLSAEAARAIADRRTGVGCDQLITIEPASNGRADAFMRIRNADGGEVEACGNGARCVADLLLRTGRTGQAGRVRIDTAGGVIEGEAAGAGRVAVDMGPARLEWQDIPLSRPSDTLHLDLARGPLADPVAVNMGNPHAVFFVPDAEAIDLATLGPALEHDTLFSERANIEVASVLGPTRIRMRVWERGVGITRACGTGACATLVAAHRRGLAGRRAEIVLDGGVLDIEWLTNGHVRMTGPVAQSFTGTLDATLLGRG